MRRARNTFLCLRPPGIASTTSTIKVRRKNPLITFENYPRGLVPRSYYSIKPSSLLCLRITVCFSFWADTAVPSSGEGGGGVTRPGVSANPRSHMQYPALGTAKRAGGCECDLPLICSSPQKERSWRLIGY
jgi:hypothetical protein